jgi:protein gp37
MAEITEISWCDHTFNPWEGCVKVSPACDNCYAEARDKRMHSGGNWGKDAARLPHSESYWKQPLKWNRQAETRERVFCGSLCDVMEDRADLQPIRERLYDLIPATPNLDWLLLTKRPQNYKRFLPASWLLNPRPNVWGMTTVESADYIWRIEALMGVEFAVYGLSMEPLLGPVTLPKEFLSLGKRAWCITGGESGRSARQGSPDWYRSLRDQCIEAGVPYHFKQYGEYNADLVRIGKKAAGRTLDGRTWDELPSPVMEHA